MTEEEDDENNDDKDEEINFADVKITINKIYKKLDIRDLIVIVMMLLMLLMYSYHTEEISRCITFYQDILQNITIKPFIYY